VSVYKWLRNTHLLLGLGASLFLLMYGLSALQLAHPSWFRPKPTVSHERIALALRGSAPAQTVAQALIDGHGLRGDVAEARVTPAGCHFKIIRPGEVDTVDYSSETGIANVERSVTDFLFFLNRFHQTGGVHHSYVWLNVWAVVTALASIVLILISLTGIYLWFKLREERVTGAFLLTVCLGFSLTLIALLRTA
jgi:hypothetical protein